MPLINDIKDILRVSGTAFDTEINDLILAAKIDLTISGVEKVNETDPLIKRAITVYCKANFGFDNQEAERFQQSYNLLKTHLSLSGDYKVIV